MGGRGSGGRNKKPTQRKVAEGNRGKRKIDLRPPVALPGEPAVPSCLNADGRRVWPEVCEILAANGVLFKTDGIAIAALCSSLVLFTKADAAIFEFGALHASVDETTGVGVLRTAPAVRVRSDALRHLRACWQAFGLDPVSRSGLDVAKKPEAPQQSALESILRAKSSKNEVVM